MYETWFISWVRNYNGVPKTVRGNLNVSAGTPFSEVLELARENLHITDAEYETIFNIHKEQVISV